MCFTLISANKHEGPVTNVADDPDGALLGVLHLDGLVSLSDQGFEGQCVAHRLDSVPMTAEVDYEFEAPFTLCCFTASSLLTLLEINKPSEKDEQE